MTKRMNWDKVHRQRRQALEEKKPDTTLADLKHERAVERFLERTTNTQSLHTAGVRHPARGLPSDSVSARDDITPDLRGWTPQLSGRCVVCNELTDEVRLVKAKDPAYRVFLHHKCRDTWTASQDPRMADLPF